MWCQVGYNRPYFTPNHVHRIIVTVKRPTTNITQSKSVMSPPELTVDDTN